MLWPASAIRPAGAVRVPSAGTLIAARLDLDARAAAGLVHLFDDEALFFRRALGSRVPGEELHCHAQELESVQARLGRQDALALHLALLHQDGAHGGRDAGALAERLAGGGHVEAVLERLAILRAAHDDRHAAALPAELDLLQDPLALTDDEGDGE